jgi:hypothetical protein
MVGWCNSLDSLFRWLDEFNSWMVCLDGWVG